MSSVWRAGSIYKRKRQDPPELEAVSMQGLKKHEASGQKQASRENHRMQAMHGLDASCRSAKGRLKKVQKMHKYWWSRVYIGVGRISMTGSLHPSPIQSYTERTNTQSHKHINRYCTLQTESPNYMVSKNMANGMVSIFQEVTIALPPELLHCAPPPSESVVFVEFF